MSEVRVTSLLPYRITEVGMQWENGGNSRGSHCSRTAEARRLLAFGFGLERSSKIPTRRA